MRRQEQEVVKEELTWKLTLLPDVKNEDKCPINPSFSATHPQTWSFSGKRIGFYDLPAYRCIAWTGYFFIFTLENRRLKCFQVEVSDVDKLSETVKVALWTLNSFWAAKQKWVWNNHFLVNSSLGEWSVAGFPEENPVWLVVGSGFECRSLGNRVEMELVLQPELLHREQRCFCLTEMKW